MDAAPTFKGLLPRLSQACEPLLLRLPAPTQAPAAWPLGASRANAGDGEGARAQPGSSARGRICSRLLAAALHGAAALTPPLTQSPEGPAASPVVQSEEARPLKRQRRADTAEPGPASQASQGQLSAGSGGPERHARGVPHEYAPNPENGALQAEFQRERATEEAGEKEEAREGEEGGGFLRRGEGEEAGGARGWEWRGVEERAEVAREIAWEALHGAPWRGVPMDWRDAHALSCWLLAFAKVAQASPGAAEGALRHLDMALLLGSSGLLQESIRACIASLQQGGLREGDTCQLEQEQRRMGVGGEGPEQPRQEEGGVQPARGGAEGPAASGLAETAGNGNEEEGKGRWRGACGSVLGPEQRQASGAQASSRHREGGLEGAGPQSMLGNALHSADAGSESPGQSGGAPQARNPLPEGAFGCWAVERRALPSLEEFLRDFMLPATPVVVTGAMAHWPALERWRDTVYLERIAGRRTVPIEVGSHYLDEAWTQELMTLSAFVARHLPPPGGGAASSQVTAGAASAGTLGEVEAANQRVARGEAGREREERIEGERGLEGEASRQAGGKSAPESVPQIGYLAQHPLFEQIPELRGDITIPEYCVLQTPRRSLGTSKAPNLTEAAPLPSEASGPAASKEAGAPGGESGEGKEGQSEGGTFQEEGGEGEGGEEEGEEEEGEVKLNAWFGPEGTVTPLHHDPFHNLLAQVVGRKYIRIYKAEDTPRLYPHTETMLQNASQVDLDSVDHTKFPLFRGTPFWDCILDQGEMLYIPPKFWHYVRSLSVSFSVSFWWE